MNIDDLRALLEQESVKADKARWKRCGHGSGLGRLVVDSEGRTHLAPMSQIPREDAYLLAALRNYAPALLDVVDAAIGVVKSRDFCGDCVVVKDMLGCRHCKMGKIRAALYALEAS